MIIHHRDTEDTEILKRISMQFRYRIVSGCGTILVKFRFSVGTPCPLCLCGKLSSL